MFNPATSASAMSRLRQRNEICVVLKRSSIIHHAYIGRNVVEILLILFFLPLNITYGWEDFDKVGMCAIQINALTGTSQSVLEYPGIVYLQCHGKKMSFFNFALWAQVILLILHLLCSFTAIIWCLYFRSITNLLKTIENENGDESSSLRRIKEVSGQDFFFLFDLLAHSCGLESTLRVLTHSDDTFYRICKPKFDHISGFQLEEDKLKVFFGPCDIERWLQCGSKKAMRKNQSIHIENYEVTIYPVESTRHTQSVEAACGSSMLDLEGGKVSYLEVKTLNFHSLNFFSSLELIILLGFMISMEAEQNMSSPFLL